MNRHIDELGRIVIPKEIRKVLKINPDDLINIIVENNKIILSKKENTIVERYKEKISFLENKKTVTDFEIGQMKAYKEILMDLEMN